MEIDIQIDSLTNCLVCRETGEQLDTEFRLVLKTISKKDAVALQQKDGNSIGAYHISTIMRFMSCC